MHMEIMVNIDDKTLTLLKAHSGKDVGSIISEALTNWTNENIPACPIDNAFCNCKEPCNNCHKVKDMH